MKVFSEKVLKAMFLNKPKISASLLTVAFLATGGALVTQQALAEPDKKNKIVEKTEQIEGVLKVIDVSNKTIIVTVGAKTGAGIKSSEDKTLSVATDASIVVARPGKDGSLTVKLADLNKGMRLSVAVSQESKAVVRIQAHEKSTELLGAVKSVDAAKNSVTISTKDKESGQKVNKTFDLARDAHIAMRGHDKGAAKSIKLGDLKEGMALTLRLSPDEKLVVSAQTAAPVVTGILKAVDAAKNSITVTHGVKQNAQDFTYEIDKNAPITLDGQPAKLGDLKLGKKVLLLLSAADSGVVGIRVGTEKDK